MMKQWSFFCSCNGGIGRLNKEPVLAIMNGDKVALEGLLS